MEQAYFSPGISQSIIPYLDNAKKEIKIAMAWFTSSELFDALIRSCSRGIKTEMILLDNAINFMYYAPDFNRFIKAGGILRIANTGFMHHKFCIVDDSFLITGSYNWTYYAETRNNENVVITTNLDLIDKFDREFLRLKNMFSVNATSPRLTRYEIERRDDVDFRELNYEIEHICKVKHLESRPYYETKTIITPQKVDISYYSKYSIGIQLQGEDGKEVFDTFIVRNVKLPVTSEKQTLLLDSKNEENLPCTFIFGDPNDLKNCQIIKEIDLREIVHDIKDENLEIEFQISLDYNGSLKIDYYCPMSKEGRTLSALDSNLVKYEQ